MRGPVGALSISLAVAAAAAGAAGAKRPALVLTSLEGSQRNSVLQERRRTSEAGCAVTERTHEVQTLRFQWRGRQAIVGRSLGVGSARLPLEVQVTGWSERRLTIARTRPRCEAESRVTTSRCEPVRLRGSARVRLPALGRVEVLGSLAGVRLGPCAPRVAPPFAFLLAAKSTYDPRFLLGQAAHGPTGGSGVVRTRIETRPGGIRRVARVTWGLRMRRSG